ncbi:MAG TPA: hypothetical protein VEK33_19655 [Terriglobales bacterium]|nr:hypothetical protein [Terriglobales bacterium]
MAGDADTPNHKERHNTTCPAPECGKEFAFEGGETRVFPLPVSLIERRYFYRSELR